MFKHFKLFQWTFAQQIHSLRQFTTPLYVFFCVNELQNLYFIESDRKISKIYKSEWRRYCQDWCEANYFTPLWSHNEILSLYAFQIFFY
jgi:hypothetical protein